MSKTKLVKDLVVDDKIALADGGKCKLIQIERMKHSAIRFDCGGGSYSVSWIKDVPGGKAQHDEWYGGNQEVELA